MNRGRHPSELSPRVGEEEPFESLLVRRAYFIAIVLALAILGYSGLYYISMLEVSRSVFKLSAQSGTPSINISYITQQELHSYIITQEGIEILRCTSNTRT